VLIYRLANPAPAIWNVIKTLVAIAIFDAVVVAGIPKLILMLQYADTGLDIFFPPQIQIGEGVLIAGTLLVLWAGMMLAISGQGTPLSFDAPRRLVIGGPYAWLRTPMVTGTLAQLIGIGVITGSVLIVVLFPVVALLWNSFVRPTEEDVLQHLFGRNFELYRRSVRAWLPMRSPWRPPPELGAFALSDIPHRLQYRRRKKK
jgi:protein-S-isoprenylcysteine O-methyltransferase Ste14